MFVLNDDLSISCTRGDAVSFAVPTEYQYRLGDIVRFQVFKKKNCTELVLRKDFIVEEEAISEFRIELDGTDTKLGGIINKPVVYWYEIEINPGKHSNTIIAYDEEGAKTFTLYPEGFDGIYTQEEFTESAYSIAVEQGYKGTKEEWLASLKGDKGDTGKSGVYLGSGDMPDDYNIQIDPNGEAFETYSKKEIDYMMGHTGRYEEAKVVALSAPYANTISGDGYGTCIVMHYSRACLVFDLGNDYGETLTKYLDDNGIKTIDAIFISHFQSDHYQLSTLQNLFAKYTVKSIVLPHTHNSLGEGNDYYIGCYNDAESAAKSANVICHKPVTEGEALNYEMFNVTCHNVSEEYATAYYDWHYTELLYDKDKNGNRRPAYYNNFSMVNVVDFAGHKIVVTGDIMSPAIGNTIDVLSTADLIFVPHHGLDIRIDPSAFNRLTAKHAVINAAYDKDAYLTTVSRAFAGELLKKGCRVTTTHDGAAVEYSVGEEIAPVRQGVLAGNEILPCSLLPYEDLNTLPDGEYVTTRESIAQTLINAPDFVTAGKNFRLVVESVYFDRNIKTQTAYNVYTSHNPEISRRSYDGEAWGAWGVFFPSDKFHAKVEASTDAEVDAALISQIADMGDATHRRVYMKLTKVISNGMGGHYDIDIFKQSENYAIITAKSPIGYGSFLQRAWFDGVLYDWEWENPRMIQGVWYRTTERYNDKAVYKTIDDNGYILCRLDGEEELIPYASLIGASGGAADVYTITQAVLAALPTWNGGSY